MRMLYLCWNPFPAFFLLKYPFSKQYPFSFTNTFPGSTAAERVKGKPILRLLFSHLITFITTQFWGKQDQDKSWRREEGWALTGWGQVNLQVHTCTSSPEHLTDKSWSPLHTITWLSRFSLLSATSLIFFIIFAASFFTSSDRKGQINLMCPKQSKQRPILGIKIFFNWFNFSFMKLKLHPLFLVHSICLKNAPPPLEAFPGTPPFAIMGWPPPPTELDPATTHLRRKRELSFFQL